MAIRARAVLWAGCALLPACSEARSPGPLPEDGVLVIELGGDNPSLRDALQALGMLPEPEPPPAPPPQETAPMEPVAPPPEPELQPEPPPEPEFFTVLLKERETLWDLAREHLGKGARWTEILALNGWTEAQARRLRAGTTVRIPRR